MGETFVLGGLIVVLLLVLTLPFVFKKVEENLEIFLFIMGSSAALIAGIMNRELIMKALEEPMMISAAVLIAGILFKVLQKQIQAGIGATLKVIPLKVFIFLVIVILGLASSVITAIISALVLVEIISILKMDRKAEVALDIIACFSIGMGAALTPLGEPLATIAISKLDKDFWYLVRAIGPYVVPGVVALGAFGAFYVKGKPGIGASGATMAGAEAELATAGEASGEEETETYKDVIIRALKVYLFVMALVFLGDGFKPLIDKFVLGLPSTALYWLNMLSAVLDNATLTAAELSGQMTDIQVKSILMGLLISGGMLIPGNIPNIVSASKLKIGSKEWAKLGLPLGLVIMGIYFAILLV